MSEDSPFQVIHHILIIPLPAIVSTPFFKNLKRDLLLSLEQSERKGIVLDFSKLEVIDAHDVTSIQELVDASNLMGVPSVLCGLNQSLVSGMVNLGLQFTGCAFTTTLEEGVQHFTC